MVAPGTDSRGFFNGLLYRSVLLTKSDKTKYEAYDCDAYGNTLIFGGSPRGTWFTDADANYITDDPECHFIFTGRRYDPETSNAATQIYFYRARYYHPLLGRFISRDPSGGLPTTPEEIPQGPVTGQAAAAGELDVEIEGFSVPGRDVLLRSPQGRKILQILQNEESMERVNRNRPLWDPLDQYADGMNLYAYCGSSPATHLDASGTIPCYCPLGYIPGFLGPCPKVGTTKTRSELLRCMPMGGRPGGSTWWDVLHYLYCHGKLCLGTGDYKCVFVRGRRRWELVASAVRFDCSCIPLVPPIP